MQRFLVFLILIFSINSINAQSGDPKVDALIRKMQKPSGQISFTFNGQKFSEKASLIKTPKSYAVVSDMMNSQNTISFKISSLATGKYELNTNDNVVMIQSKVYVFKGSINLKVSGTTASGSFSGNAFAIKNKTKPSATSSGTISGTFSGLSE